VLDEFGEVLHVLRFADGTPGESGGGAGDVDLGAQPGVGPVVDEAAHRRAVALGRRQDGRVAPSQAGGEGALLFGGDEQ
jgi:hypothetical protein